MLLHWKHVLALLGQGKKDGVSTMEIPVLTSLCYYATCVIIARLLRQFIKRTTKRGKTIQVLLFDFVTSFQIMAMSLENGQLRKHYGDTAYVLALLSTGLWTFYTVEDGLANPCGCVVDVMKGHYGISKALKRNFVQLCGGLLSYQFARLFWALGLTYSHWERYNLVYCRSDLTVTSPLGFVIEFSATLINTMICFNTFSSYRHSENLSKCLFGSYLTLLGIDLTGMYLNPVNATNQTFGCHGPYLVEFFMVYWVAPLLATAIAVRAQNELRVALKRMIVERDTENGLNVKFSDGVLPENGHALVNDSVGAGAGRIKTRKWFSSKNSSKRR